MLPTQKFEIFVFFFKWKFFEICTDLGSLIGIFDYGVWIFHKPKCRNLTIFLPLWFYVKSFLVIFHPTDSEFWFQKVKNCCFCNFAGCRFRFLEKCHTWKCQNFPKFHYSKLLKWSKWHCDRLQNGRNWFHVKYEW